MCGVFFFGSSSPGDSFLSNMLSNHTTAQRFDISCYLTVGIFGNPDNLRRCTLFLRHVNFVRDNLIGQLAP